MKLKTGDKVVVIAGKDKGKEGTITKTLKDLNKVVVEGVHIVKKHQRPSATSTGGIVEVEAKIDASNVMLLDPTTDAATKVGVKFVDGKKVRFSKRTGAIID